MLKIINKIKLDTPFLENMLEWCRKEIKLPKYWLKEAKFKFLPGTSIRNFDGTSIEIDRRIIVSISRRLEFPIQDWGYRGRFAHTYEDVYELLVSLTAHEMYHQYQDYKKEKRNLEFDACKNELYIFNKFVDDKDRLLKEWGYKPNIILVGMRSGKIISYGSKEWYDQTLLELIDIHRLTGGDMNITVDELINYYRG